MIKETNKRTVMTNDKLLRKENKRILKQLRELDAYIKGKNK